jgi:hypothetical protein
VGDERGAGVLYRPEFFYNSEGTDSGGWVRGRTADNGNWSATPRRSPVLLAWQQLALCLHRLMWERGVPVSRDCKCNRKCRLN